MLRQNSPVLQQVSGSTFPTPSRAWARKPTKARDVSFPSPELCTQKHCRPGEGTGAFGREARSPGSRTRHLFGQSHRNESPLPREAFADCEDEGAARASFATRAQERHDDPAAGSASSCASGCQSSTKGEKFLRFAERLPKCWLRGRATSRCGREAAGLAHEMAPGHESSCRHTSDLGGVSTCLGIKERRK